MQPPDTIYEIRAHDDSGEWWAVDYQLSPLHAKHALRVLAKRTPVLTGWVIAQRKVQPVWN